jgi:hypothetical protein
VDFVERRIEQARRAGFFDDLVLHGEPIPDLDEERPAGWWAKSYVARDRSLRRLHELVAELPRRKGITMLDDDHEVVRSGLMALDAELAAANEMVEPKGRAAGMDIEGELRAWRERRRQQRWGRYLQD